MRLLAIQITHLRLLVLRGSLLLNFQFVCALPQWVDASECPIWRAHVARLRWHLVLGEISFTPSPLAVSSPVCNGGEEINHPRNTWELCSISITWDHVCERVGVSARASVSVSTALIGSTLTSTEVRVEPCEAFVTMLPKLKSEMGTRIRQRDLDVSVRLCISVLVHLYTWTSPRVCVRACAHTQTNGYCIG